MKVILTLTRVGGLSSQPIELGEDGLPFGHLDGATGLSVGARSGVVQVRLGGEVFLVCLSVDCDATRGDMA